MGCTRAGVANQSETKAHIFYCKVTAKSHVTFEFFNWIHQSSNKQRQDSNIFRDEILLCSRVQKNISLRHTARLPITAIVEQNVARSLEFLLESPASLNPPYIHTHTHIRSDTPLLRVLSSHRFTVICFPKCSHHCFFHIHATGSVF